MNNETKYRYQKRIKELEEENARLSDYRYICMNIFDACQEAGDSANGISKKWLLSQFRKLFK